MEVALRAVNLLVSYLLLAGRLDERTERAWLSSLGAHARHLARFPESSDVQGNHHLVDADSCESFELRSRLIGSADEGSLEHRIEVLRPSSLGSNATHQRTEPGVGGGQETIDLQRANDRPSVEQPSHHVVSIGELVGGAE